MAHEPIVSANVRPRGEKRAARWPIAVVALVTLGVLAVVPFLLLRPDPAGSTLKNYQTATVGRTTLIQRVGGAGVIVPRFERSVLAGEAGVVSTLAVVAGDEVLVGEAIATLRAEGLDRELTRVRAALESSLRSALEIDLVQASEAAAATAAIASLETALGAAQANQTLTAELLAMGAVSSAELNAAVKAVSAAEAAARAAAEREARDAQRRRLAADEAQASVAAARAEVELVESRLAKLTVTAPIAGRVIEVRVPEGGVVSAGTVVAVIASTTDLSVRVDVRESQASRVVVGQSASLRLAGAAVPGTVSWVAPQAHTGEAGSVVTVAVDVAGSPADLRLGGSVTAEIEVGRTDDALFLPRGLFLATGGERYAFVVDGGVARRRSVVFGMVDGDRVEVLDGLEEGEVVIVSSYEGIVDRSEVTLAQRPGGAVSR